MKYKILDCTLRDGGYYTNWDFSPKLVRDYVSVSSALPIDYLEVGYRNPPAPGYFGEYYYLPTSLLRSLRDAIPANIKLAAMLDAKNCTESMMPFILKDCEGLIGLIRLAVDPAKIENFIGMARIIKEHGIDVSFNLMYLSKYKDMPDYLLNIKKCADVTDYIYLVDSYGACFPHEVKDIVTRAKKALPQKIGFHGHDNLSLAFANSLAAIEAGVDIVDSTFFGMGRGAGNLRTELLISYVKHVSGETANLSLLPILLDEFRTLHDKYHWGIELPYIISGLSDLPQKEVMEWIERKRYSTSTITSFLQKDKHKPSADKSYKKLVTSAKQLGLDNIKSCIIIGGGKSAAEYHDSIIAYCKKSNGLIIHSSLKSTELYANDDVRQVLCIAGDEGEKLKALPESIRNCKFTAYIVSSPPRMVGQDDAEFEDKVYEVDPIAPLVGDARENMLIKDAPLSIGLGAANALNISRILVAGFDGYTQASEIQQQLATENQNVFSNFISSYPKTKIESIVPTRYSIPKTSVHLLLRELE